ncbi:hypothetical protein RJT34_23980 [Clitoria ternatea]|uniref:Uncharacterized protein n=1 Tax=Clitoria ternatea TaxID=43366 RepID=A0AAN9FM82_CLITE
MTCSLPTSLPPSCLLFSFTVSENHLFPPSFPPSVISSVLVHRLPSSFTIHLHRSVSDFHSSVAPANGEVDDTTHDGGQPDGQPNATDGQPDGKPIATDGQPDGQKGNKKPKALTDLKLDTKEERP